MRYIAAVTNVSKSSEIDKVKDVLIQSNSILEAFGNAKTNRNDNSSRFGKYMDIMFDFKADPIGGHIQNYLLEKNRVVHQQKGERNFHIFYQFLCGADSSQLQAVSLEKDLKKYRFLHISESEHSFMPTDQKNFEEVVTAIKTLEFSDQQGTIWAVLASVLHLGNISYKEGKNDEAVFENPKLLDTIAKLLQVRRDSLEQALSHRLVSTRAEQIDKPLSVRDAETARDAFAKSIYERLFKKIVDLINDTIKVEGKNTGSIKHIGVLDIYGFEIFQQNSFEQFCINYCNEKLQHLFISQVLHTEQEEYKREGVPWTHITYFDNEPLVKLIEATPMGMLALLDEACINPGFTADTDYLDCLDRNLKGHERYSSRQLNKEDRDLVRDRDFRIKHYAGDVIYDVTGFMDKHRDMLFADFKRLLFTSNNKLVKSLAPDGDQGVEKVQKRPTNSGTAFKNSMIELIEELKTKSPFYVRCIKPNSIKSAGEFDTPLVLHQVKYLNLLETTRVRRAGYVYRMDYKIFLLRYKMLSEKTWPNQFKDAPKDGTQILMKSLGKEGDCCFGKTKIFIRSPQTIVLLEDKRRDKIVELVTKIQKCARLMFKRRYFQKCSALYAPMKKKLPRRRAEVERVGFPPKPKKDIEGNLPLFKSALLRWWAYMMLQRIEKKKLEETRFKIYAGNMLMGKRTAWGVERDWIGDYIPQEIEDVNDYSNSIHIVKQLLGFEKVIFSSMCRKLNYHGQTNDRAFVVTDRCIFRLDPVKKYKLREKKKWVIDLASLQKLSVRKGRDQLVILSAQGHHDLVIVLNPKRSAGIQTDRIGEFVGILASAFYRKTGKELHVEIRDDLTCQMKGKTYTIKVTHSSEAESHGGIFQFKDKMVELLVP